MCTEISTDKIMYDHSYQIHFIYRVMVSRLFINTIILVHKNISFLSPELLNP